MMNWRRTAMLLLIGSAIAATPAFAKDDRVSFANDITVEEGSTSGDLVCMMCSIKVHGEVRGDVVTLLGNVIIDEGRSISGDVATVGGDVSIGDGGDIHGDVAVVGGYLNKGSGVTIGGDSKVMAGKGWLLVPFAPLLIFLGLVWLIVWLATRRRYRFPMYPQGRGF